MRKVLLAAVLILATGTPAEARTKKTVKVQYETELGWSNGVCRSVDFFAGSEVDFLVARKAGIKYLKNYAAVWFAQDEVVLVELRGITWIGEATEDSVTIFVPWTGEDKEGRRWRFSNDLTCPGW